MAYEKCIIIIIMVSALKMFFSLCVVFPMAGFSFIIPFLSRRACCRKNHVLLLFLPPLYIG